MSWEREPLWVKSRLFFEHAMAHDRDDPRFGLWCAFGLELLARAAVSSISPTLLGNPPSSWGASTASHTANPADFNYGPRVRPSMYDAVCDFMGLYRSCYAGHPCAAELPGC